MSSAVRRFPIDNPFGKGWLAAGYLFLYLPIVSLVIYSFNDSQIPNLWAGFTFKWYGKLANDGEILSGLWLSLKIAVCSATGSVMLGTLAAFALTKYKRFKGRTLFSGMVSALLLMLVSIQRAIGSPERGMLTIWLGHVLTGMAYATVVVQARLQDLNPQLEEAAMDLGARPAQVFRLVTLPMITQALMSAWLLTFTISLDDVVLAAFLSGPGSTTMPLVIFSRARLGLNPTVNAVATVIITIVAIGTVIASILIARAEKERAKAIAQAQRDG